MSRFKISLKKYRNGIDYDRDRDYSAEMAKAKEAGDTALLAQLEDERNKKIDGEKMPYAKTYNYIDVGTKIENGIRDGESPYEIKELVDARREKATQNEIYDAYKNDEIQKKGLKYYYDAESGAGYGYQDRPEKKDSYAGDIKNLLARVTAKDSFDYDPGEDEVFQNLKSQMENESRRAATDVLADIGAESGGKSSYAVSAAMQAANNFNAKLAEQVPKLYEIAYKRYSDSRENDRKALDSVLKAAETEQNVYLDEMEQYNADRDFAVSSYERTLDRMQEEDENKYEQEKDVRDFNYKAEQDALEAQQKAQELALKREQANLEAEQKAIESARKLVQHYEENGITSPPELLSLAGMSSYSDLNEASADYYRNKLNLETAVKNKQIENYNARTSKTYSDMANNAEKLALQKAKAESEEKDGKDLDLDTVIVKNRQGAGGYYIGKELIPFAKVKSGLKNGTLVYKRNADGTITIAEKE